MISTESYINLIFTGIDQPPSCLMYVPVKEAYTTCLHNIWIFIVNMKIKDHYNLNKFHKYKEKQGKCD